MNESTHILVVDDDAEIRELLRGLLEKHQYTVSVAANGTEMFDALKDNTINLILLDVMMPGEDGLVLCKKLRETSNIPVIMVTAMGDAVDCVLGLEIGADDYVGKPFHSRELIARIKAILRRREEKATQSPISILQSNCELKFAGWRLNKNTRQLLSPDEVEVSLSNSEYNLLLTFLENPNQVLSRDQLLDNMHSNYDIQHFDRSIDVQVSRLRQRIEENPKHPDFIKTVRGGGYLFSTDVVSA